MLFHHKRCPLLFVDGMMKTQKYGEVISNFILPAIEDQYGHTSGAIFQYDSAQCHRAKSVSLIWFLIPNTFAYFPFKIVQSVIIFSLPGAQIV